MQTECSIKGLDDIYIIHTLIYRKYKQLIDLLIAKLKKYEVYDEILEESAILDPETGKLRIHTDDLVKGLEKISTKTYYNTEYTEPSAIIYTGTLCNDYINSDGKVLYSLMGYKAIIDNKTQYYADYLRYYLEQKGVDVNKIAEAQTLKELILLIDLIKRKRKTHLRIRLNSDGKFYYGNNLFKIWVIDETGEKVSTGRIKVYNNGYWETININNFIAKVNNTNEHTYKFQYYDPSEKYDDSEEVEFTYTPQPMPVTFTASLINNTQRHYLDQTDSLKGYIDDTWTANIYVKDINGFLVDIPKVIKIYDEEEPRIYETNGSTYNIKFNKHNYDNNGEPTNVQIRPITSEPYVFDNKLAEFDVNVIYPFYSVNPLSNYTGKHIYSFEVTFYNEYNGEINNDYNHQIVNLAIEGQNYEDSLVHSDSVTINNGKASLIYRNNIPIDQYKMIIELGNVTNDDTIINILPNFLYTEGTIYLNDEPSIEFLNNQSIKKTTIKVFKQQLVTIIDEETNKETTALDFVEIAQISNVENNQAIFPTETKAIGVYKVTIKNRDTNESFEYYYTIKEPYTYTINTTNTQMTCNLHIDDIDDFDIENITDYIKIHENETELEYKYIENNNDISIIANTELNPDFKGNNTLTININNYELTINFTLKGTEEIYEITNDVNIHSTDIQIIGYDDTINTINVVLKYDNNTIKTWTSVNKNGEIFTLNLDSNLEAKNYTIEIEDNIYPNTVLDLNIPAGILDVQEFQIKNRISPKETPNKTNSLGFGLNTAGPIEENISVVFYYDNPKNQLATKTYKTTSTRYYIDINSFLGKIPKGQHTLYAKFHGSENYQPFLISKSFMVSSPTRIIYDTNDDNIVEQGQTIYLSLLTLDYDKRIVNKGQYIINGNTYDIHSEVINIPLDGNIAGEYVLNIRYQGIDEYEDSTATITYLIELYDYDFYASSIFGLNSNSGTSPTNPVKDIDTLLNLQTTENDKLCLMAGEYHKDLLDTNAIFYGYVNDNIEDIKVNIQQLAPNTSVTLCNLVLDTGNGYVRIIEPYKLINNSNQIVELYSESTEPIEYDTVENIYQIAVEEEIIYTKNGKATIRGVVIKNNNPVENRLVKAYKNTSIQSAATTDMNGEFALNIENIIKNTKIIIKAINCEKTILIITNPLDEEFDEFEIDDGNQNIEPTPLPIILFEDDCTTNNTSNYTIKKGTISNINFVFRNPRYRIGNTARGKGFVQLPQIILPSSFRITMKGYVATTNWCTFGVGLIKNRGTDNDFYGFLLDTDGQYEYFKLVNNSSSTTDATNISNIRNTFLHIIEYNNGTLTGILKTDDETTTVATITKTISESISDLQVAICIGHPNGNAGMIENIKIESM